MMADFEDFERENNERYEEQRYKRRLMRNGNFLFIY